jgi:ABC-type ATPase with predicted acetyltransferase domain
MRMFGVDKQRLRDNRKIHKCDLDIADGDIVYITGPSGAGKSVLLREIQNQIPPAERISIDDIPLPAEKSVIDCVTEPVSAQRSADSGLNKLNAERCSLSLIEAMRLLGYAGLSDVFCMLTAPANLSEGQKYRFRLACCLAAGKAAIFADEFCSNLDRITAGVIAYNVRRFTKKAGVTFFLASSHEDILADLQPDVLVVKRFMGPAEVSYKNIKNKNAKSKNIEEE